MAFNLEFIVFEFTESTDYQLAISANTNRSCLVWKIINVHRKSCSMASWNSKIYFSSYWKHGKTVVYLKMFFCQQSDWKCNPSFLHYAHFYSALSISERISWCLQTFWLKYQLLYNLEYRRYAKIILKKIINCSLLDFCRNT